MNLAFGLEWDRETTEKDKRIAELEATVRQQSVYIKQLEAAVLSAPLYTVHREMSASESEYTSRKREWFDNHRHVLHRAASDPILERESYRRKAKNKVAQMRNRITTLAQRVEAGDLTAKVPSLNDLWAMLSSEMATI